MSNSDMPNLTRSRRQLPVARRARGMALVFVLIMMSIIFVIAAVSSRLVTEGERTARNDRDRQTALQAAEVALSDAEVDIMGPTSLGTRVSMFGTLPAGEGCSTEATTRGYCGRLLPSSSTTSLLDIYRPIFAVSDTSSSRAYATFGEFTGRDDEFAVSSGGALPSRLPRYVIEKTSLNFRNRSQTVGKPLDAYIVTAIGYGLNPETQVILQAVISKPVATN
jgi:type IV pilus assembly protein PilX